MFNKTTTALLLSVALVGAAQAQNCPCNGGTGTKLNTAEITAMLGNRMACATVGNEQWQEWHNGTSSGPVVDYKKGPSDKVDPSAQVGSYNVAGDTVTYTYGSQPYQYAVCRTGSGTTFCGSPFGGRDINAVVGGSGLQSCSGVTQVTAAARPIAVPKAVVTPKPATVKP
jgi:hypothetical protein